MSDLSLNDILVTPLKRIPTDGGDVMHALKNSDNGFNGFGEVYFSWVEQGSIKAWKCHQRMTLNLVVPLGEVYFVFHLAKEKDNFKVETIGAERYVRLTVPPGIWFGFKGLSKKENIILNLTNVEHNPKEILRRDKNKIKFNW